MYSKALFEAVLIHKYLFDRNGYLLSHNCVYSISITEEYLKLGNCAQTIY